MNGHTIARVRAGRNRRRYRPAIDVAMLHRQLLGHLDRDALRELIESHALATRHDETLLELLCAFEIERSLRHLGWKVRRPGLLTKRFLTAEDALGRKLQMYYQHTPEELARSSIYGQVQRNHALNVGGLRPDLVLELRTPEAAPSWLMVEVKGVQRSVDKSARAAALDLLAYRRSFNEALQGQPEPYGLGIAWGSDLDISQSGEVRLCTPDRIENALALMLR